MKTTLTQVPFWDALANAKRILIAGAGGGCDIYCGLPIYFALQNQECEVHLANLTFSNLHGAQGVNSTPSLLTIDADAGGNETYFPERRLCEWFRSRGEIVEVHCLGRTGVRPLAEAYGYLAESLDLDAIVLVDGGTDSLARGDEAGLGTPQEDMASLAAVAQTDVKQKLLLCIGFGVDVFHGICHAQFLESVSAISTAGGFLGAFSVLASMPEAKLYRDAVDYLCRYMVGRESIVNTSVIAAIQGVFGDYHATKRTRDSEMWINPLMSMYWAFELSAVVNRSLYLDRIRETDTYRDLCLAIEEFRHESNHRPWQSIPV